MPSLAPGSQLPLVVGKNNPSARYSNNTQDDSQPGLKKVYWSRPYIGSGMAVLMETDNGIGVDIGDRRINANAIQTHNTPIPSPSLPPSHHHLRQNKFWDLKLHVSTISLCWLSRPGWLTVECLPYIIAFSEGAKKSFALLSVWSRFPR